MTNVDSIYYRDGVNTNVAMNILKKARFSLFHLFMQEMAPTKNMRIIDIGVSDDENEGSNYLEKFYPWQENITCAGIGDGEALKKAFPSITFQHIVPGEPLPFADKSFDIAYSNAVLEHVGSREQRIFFMQEHLRIAKAVFIAIPNRWFPVEHHTSVPLLHYIPAIFRRLLANTRFGYWTKIENLDFLDRFQLAREWPGKKTPSLYMSGLPLGPFSSNIALISKD